MKSGYGLNPYDNSFSHLKRPYLFKILFFTLPKINRETRYSEFC